MAMTLNELQSQLTGLDQYQKTDEATLRGRAESIYRPQYEQDILSLKDSLNTQLAQQGRSALANGMQRSSYNQAAAASIRGSGLRAQSELAANYEGNVAAALQNMLDKENDRADAADANRNNLLLQLYQLGNSGRGGSTPSTTPVDTKTDDKNVFNLDDEFDKKLRSLNLKTSLNQYDKYGVNKLANANDRQKSNILTDVANGSLTVNTTKPLTLSEALNLKQNQLNNKLKTGATK